MHRRQSRKNLADLRQTGAIGIGQLADSFRGRFLLAVNYSAAALQMRAQLYLPIESPWRYRNT